MNCGGNISELIEIAIRKIKIIIIYKKVGERFGSYEKCKRIFK